MGPNHRRRSTFRRLLRHVNGLSLLLSCSCCHHCGVPPVAATAVRPDLTMTKHERKKKWWKIEAGVVRGTVCSCFWQVPHVRIRSKRHPGPSKRSRRRMSGVGGGVGDESSRRRRNPMYIWIFLSNENDRIWIDIQIHLDGGPSCQP